MYNIRYARKEDLPLIIKFLDAHWKKNHALVVSQELMDFQHLNPITGDYNFIIAENKKTRELDAMSGYIPVYQYDFNLYKPDEVDLWGAIWKVRDDIREEDMSLLAVFLFEKYIEIPYAMTYSSIGLSGDAIKAYKAMRHFVGVLPQYYILNNTIEDFKIAKVGKLPTIIEEKASADAKIIGDLNIKLLTEADIVAGAYRPKKSVAYLKNRYLYHPFYKYIFWGIEVAGRLETIWVLRMVEANGARALRIVDMYGAGAENIPYLYAQLQGLLSEYEAEYIDCLNYGFDEAVFGKMGFLKLDTSSDEVIIPDYFEPFEQHNNSLYFTYKLKNKKDRYVIFKGDADQDRPNIIR
jgi:hypothetical protein